jgi:hypothetical protein
MPTRPRSTFTRIACLALLVSASTCQWVDQEAIETCTAYCNVLSSCDMLPSFLGTDAERDSDDDCVYRCTISSTVREQVGACLISSESLDLDPDVTDIQHWCAHGKCARLAECLSSTIDPDLLGSGTVSSELCRITDPVSRIAVTEDFVLEQCFDGCEQDGTCSCADTLLDEEVVKSICGQWEILVSTGATDDASDLVAETIAIGKVTLALRNHSRTLELASGHCPDVLARAHETEVPPGLYRTFVVVYGESGGCFEIPGEQFLVTSGAEVSATWLLPDSLTDVVVTECESSKVQCSDGIDNNRDGSSDCNDLSCAAYCTEDGARCADGIDNDLDGDIDCEDPDCTTATACSTDSDSTDSTDSSDSDSTT